MTPSTNPAAEAVKPKRSEHERMRRREQKKRARLRNPGKEAERHRIYRHDNAEKVQAYAIAKREADPELYRAHNLKSYLKRKAFPKSPARVECHRRASRRREIRRCKDQVALDLRVIARADAVVPRNLSRFTRGSIIALIASRIFSGHLPMRLTKAHGAAATAEVLGTQERSNG